MIGRRATLTGVVAIGLTGAVLSVDAHPEPAVTASRGARLASVAAEADRALGALEAELRGALDAGRRGSARVVSGTASPAEDLEAAADALVEAAPTAESVEAAMVTLGGTARALAAEDIPTAPTTPAELTSIGAQLRATAPAADTFAGMRRTAGETLQALDTALAALEGGDVPAAQAAVEAANDLLDTLAGWNPGLVTLPIWLDTARNMAAALERLVTAVQAGDRAAADQAQRDFAAASSEAREADVALQIAVAEGGAAVAEAPLGRLVSALRRTTEARAELASILHPTPSPAP
jgi:hypothetical protein